MCYNIFMRKHNTPKPLPSYEELHDTFEYRDGTLYWKPKPGLPGNGYNGKPAGAIMKSSGYVCIQFNRTNYKAHRLIWKMFYNEEPQDLIDHIDTNKSNNKIENLQTIDNNKNILKQKKRKDNTTGFQGVTLTHLKDGTPRYRAVVNINKTQHHLGYYSNAEEAAEVAKNFKEKYLISNNVTLCQERTYVSQP